MANLTAARQGRLNKALAKRFTFDDGVATLGEHIRRFTWHRKDLYVQEHYSKERSCYKPKLATPKTWYTIWRWEGEKETGLTVPKIVWEYLADVPEAEYKPYESPIARPIPNLFPPCPKCGGPTDRDGYGSYHITLYCMEYNFEEIL